MTELSNIDKIQNPVYGFPESQAIHGMWSNTMLSI